VNGLARLVLGADSTPGWVCVGHPEPERHAEVRLHGLAEPVDVSANHAMVSLVPFQVAIRLDGLAPGPRPWLSVRERGGPELGRVRLRLAREVAAAPYRIGLFATEGCVNRCLPAPRLHAHYLVQRWKLLRDRNPRNVKMVPAELFAKFVLFTAPRPVVLVSHERDGKGNLFPMDLVGEAGPPCYLLGLHRTSPAIEAMTRAGRLAVSTVPLAWKKTVFALGRNHRAASVDRSGLPFATVPSPLYGIPVPSEALTVREVRIERVVEADSHVLFVTTTESLEKWSDGLQMCHTHGFYQMYLRGQGRPLPEAPHPLAPSPTAHPAPGRGGTSPEPERPDQNTAGSVTSPLSRSGGSAMGEGDRG
jgi:flavin reductase (DIM6/NTAB) family NADH-FMN oxidoreductase RutF